MDKEPPPVVESSEMAATVAQQTPDIQYINGNVEAEYEDSQGPPTKKPRLEQQDTIRHAPVSLDAVIGVQLVILKMSIRNKPLLEVNTMLIRYEKCRHLMDMYAAMFLRLGRCFPLGSHLNQLSASQSQRPTHSGMLGGRWMNRTFFTLTLTSKAIGKYALLYLT